TSMYYWCKRRRTASRNSKYAYQLPYWECFINRGKFTTAKTSTQIYTKFTVICCKSSTIYCDRTRWQIGRASCREREKITGGAGLYKRKKKEKKVNSEKETSIVIENK